MILPILLVLAAQVPDHVEANPDQYMMSPVPGDTYGLSLDSSGGASDCRPVTIGGVYSDPGTTNDDNVLLPWGSQWSFINESGGIAMLCLHQTRNTTVSLGTNAGAVTFDSAVSSSGRAKCISLPASGVAIFKVSKAEWTCSGVLGARSPPTCRRGRCTAVAETASANDAVVGGGCSAAADCGTGTCDLTLPPLGVYASICAEATTGDVQLQRAGQ